MWRLVAYFAVLCLSQSVWADVPMPRGLFGDRRFMSLVEQGRSALERNEPAKAIVVLEDAYRYMPRPGLLYLLGRAALQENRPRAAVDLYRRYQEMMGDDAEPELKTELSQILQNPLEVGAELTVVGVNGGLVSVDGYLVGALPLATPVQLAAGKHQVVLVKDGRKVESQLTLLPRRAAEVRFTLKPPLAVTTLTPGVLLFVEPVNLEPGFMTNLRKHISEAVTHQKAVLVSPELQADVMARHRDLFGCLGQASCQEQLARQSEAQYVLRLSFELGPAALSVPELQAKGARKPVTAYRYSVTVLDVEVGAIASSATDSCVESQCAKLMPRIVEMVQELLKTAANKPRGTLILSSEPPDAGVTLGGRSIGKTPLRRDAFIGQYDVVVDKPGYVPSVTSVVIEDNKEQPVAVTLSPVPVAPPSRTRSILKWTTLGVGVLATAAGATLLGLNGRPTACASDPTMSCPFDGRAGGAVLLTVGTLAIGGSLALFILDGKQSQGATTSTASVTAVPSALAPTPTPAVTLSLDF